MRRILWIAAMAVLGITAPARAFLGGDSVSCLWPDKPVQVDGRATEWSDLPVMEDAGMAFRAMNDESSLYLLIRGTTNDGRILLAGKYRQNVTLWFLKPDHKTKTWGINLDFGRARPLAPEAPPTLDALGIAPERILPQGLEVSTTTFPQGFEFQADLSSQRGRQPIYEIRIPLDMIERHGKVVSMEIVSSEVSPEVKTELQAEVSSGHAGSEEHKGGAGAPGGGGGRHHRGVGGSPGGGNAASTIEIPKPLHLELAITLVKEPKH